MTPQRGRLLSGGVLLGALLAVILAVVLGQLQAQFARRPLPGPGVTPLPVGAVEPLPPGAVRVLAAGDIGRCGSLGADATGALIRAIPDASVLALGDLAYDSGTDADFRDCYDPAWGHARGRTLPVPGNHEYRSPGATGYFGYFGAAAGTPAVPWRAVDLGGWRVYLLDAECSLTGACGDGRAQLAWLAEDLASRPAACTLAALHRPRYSSGPHGPQGSADGLWRVLAAGGVDVVVAAHDHLYERFARLDAEGRPSTDGTRSWVVGTGGGELYPTGTPQPGSEASWDRAHGLLELILRPDGYDWRFRAAIGEPFEDTGSDTC